MFKQLRNIPIAETSHPDWFRRLTKHDYVVECDNGTGRLPLYTVEDLEKVDPDNPFWCSRCGEHRVPTGGTVCKSCKDRIEWEQRVWAEAKCLICGEHALTWHVRGFRCGRHYWTNLPDGHPDAPVIIEDENMIMVHTPLTIRVSKDDDEQWVEMTKKSRTNALKEEETLRERLWNWWCRTVKWWIEAFRRL